MSPKCIKCVDGNVHCSTCQSKCVKNGFSKAGKQRYKCRICKRTFLEAYRYKAYHHQTNQQLVRLLKDSVGIRGMGRILEISPTTVQRRILRIAKHINKPMVIMNQSYELDEMCTYVGSKANRTWIAYAIRRNTKSVVDFSIGKRTNQTLKKVVETLHLAQATRIYTDKLRNYQGLIAQEIHDTTQKGINHIERKNLTLRTHLKRLSRRTICFSKSMQMLKACLTIYFWS